MSCNRHDGLVNQYLAEDLANELTVMAQNDLMIDSHYLPDGEALLEAARIIRRLYVEAPGQSGS